LRIVFSPCCYPIRLKKQEMTQQLGTASISVNGMAKSRHGCVRGGLYSKCSLDVAAAPQL
jgi:hypothetical protein